VAWLLLVLGGLFEVAFTICLRFAEGFRNLPWTIGFLVSVTLSMTLLERAARTIPMGTAYAVWVGIGAAGAALTGVLFFGEPAGAVRLLLLALLVGAIIGLKLVSPA
jgi:quaternary ammonium compound-resistance protein SugE